MKIKILLWSIWLFGFGIIITGFVNYNIQTFKEDVIVKFVRKYRPFREHKGQTYYAGGYNMIVKHSQYGYADIGVNVDTYESYKEGDIVIFSWSQSQLEKHFRNYPERVWYLHLDNLVILSFVVLVICFIISFILA